MDKYIYIVLIIIIGLLLFIIFRPRNECYTKTSLINLLDNLNDDSLSATITSNMFEEPIKTKLIYTFFFSGSPIRIVALNGYYEKEGKLIYVTVLLSAPSKDYNLPVTGAVYFSYDYPFVPLLSTPPAPYIKNFSTPLYIDCPKNEPPSNCSKTDPTKQYFYQSFKEIVFTNVYKLDDGKGTKLSIKFST